MGIDFMKKLTGYLLISSMLVFCLPASAEAQFWKNWFQKKEAPVHHYKPVHKDPTPVMPKPGPLKKKIEQQYPASTKKSNYRIDVLTPLYIDELDKADKKIPDRSLNAVQFYEGIKLAVDTLNSFHYNIQVYIHDIAAPGATADLLIANHKLDSADLLIGGVQSKDISVLAAFAKKRKINFISALSPSDASIKDNPYFILTQPTLQVHCNYLMGYIQKKHPNQKMVLLYRTNVSSEQGAYSYIIDNDEPAAFKKLLCNSLPAKNQLSVLLDSTKVNVIIISVLDNTYADLLLRNLHDWFPNYRFEVYGMPSWKTLPSLKKPDAYPNIAVYFTYPFHFDPSIPAIQNIDRNYKNEYGGRPSEIVYRAYETMYLYSYLLIQYGPIFNNRFSDNSANLFTKYDIEPKLDKNGNFLYNENQHIYLYRYQSSSYIVEQ